MTAKLVWRLVGAAVLIALAPGILPNAYAQVYTCKDKSGRMHTSDRPIPECSDQPMREVYKSGVVRMIPAPLSSEQKLRQEVEEYRRKQSEAAVREQLRKDRALLASYSSVEEIEAGRKRALADAQEALDGTVRRIAELEKDRAEQMREASRYKNRPVPPSLQRRIDENETMLSIEEKNRADSQADVDRINKRYNAEKRRYLEITAP